MASPATKLQSSPQDLTPAGLFASRERRKLVICLSLVVATLAFYNPISHDGFILLDDVPYILSNPPVLHGLTWSTVKWSFTTFHAGYWHPLTWLSHALDCQLFGTNPAGHHYVSLLFHAASAVLLFLVLQEATALLWPSLTVALLFAAHPINVESVAWAAERKNVLSMFFFLLAMWDYGRYARLGGVGRYLKVVLWFVLGLMAKPQIITLPCVLLLWDYWPLRRAFASGEKTQEGQAVPRSVGYLILEKIPLFVIVVLSSIITVLAQKSADAVRSLSEYSLIARVENSVVCYGRYLAKIFFPYHLAPLYPHPGNTFPLWQVLVASAVLVGVTGFVLWQKQRRYLAVGWFWFLGVLVPMIGLVQVGEQSMADRFAYVPLIGLLIAVVWGIYEFAQQRHIAAKWLAIPSGAIVLALGLLTYHQLGYWETAEKLWRYTLSVTESNYMAHDNLAMVLDKQGRVDEAVPEFRAAESLHNYPLPQVLSMGIYEQRNGYVPDAVRMYTKVMQNSPDANLRATAASQLGSAYAQVKDYEQARQSYERALQLNPNEASALIASGVLAERAGDFALAAERFAHGVRIEPTDVGFLLLADADLRTGRPQDSLTATVYAQKISADFSQAQKAVVQTQHFFGYDPGNLK